MPRRSTHFTEQKFFWLVLALQRQWVARSLVLHRRQQRQQYPSAQLDAMFGATALPNLSPFWEASPNRDRSGEARLGIASRHNLNLRQLLHASILA
ncbi:hypothetical protein KR51_00031280, partial [Rubidibacter lacunae KORDI 51-2]